MKRILPLLAVTLLLSACGTFGHKDDDKNLTAEQMYKQAMDELQNNNYEKAVKGFEALEARFPYGSYAQQAELEIAYANFKDGENEQALSAIDRFLKQHPTHPSVDYALYLKGLVNFTVDRSFFAKLAHQNMAERDPKAARESFNAFRELVTRFPQSRYSEDAR
ncbi:MAG: tetratricopeptide repeat protein, partial [Burkholderiales bacterium]|nr:tetratricopeptide repeat protein [Burkholderiales bacterium]